MIDAARWAAGQKLAKADRIAVMGARFGGASAVSVLTLNVQDFACAIALDAPLDLHDAPLAGADDATLKALSPVFAAGKITKPLLLVRRDWRLPRAEADEFVAALATNKRPIVYAQFSAEAEGFASAADRLAFHALAASFLSKCLGGRADPIGADFRNSSLQIVQGGDYIPSLSSAMAPRDDDLGSPP
jgi:dipeptidyl aminopeptidase/acylaminoacyl peptidase